MEPASAHNRYHYNPKLKAYARRMRNKSTPAEIRLWREVMRKGSLAGYTFNRQRPVLNYIADFLCTKLMLIIEVDGGIHDQPSVRAYDRKRQADLESVGFTVLRFRNEEVMREIARVREQLEAFVGSNPPPSPVD